MLHWKAHDWLDLRVVLRHEPTLQCVMQYFACHRFVKSIYNSLRLSLQPDHLVYIQLRFTSPLSLLLGIAIPCLRSPLALSNDA